MNLALDFGATNMRAALVHGTRIREKRVVKTPKTKKEIIQALFDLISSYGEQKVICAGVASFMKNGKTKNTTNMDFAGVQVDKLIAKQFKASVFVDNDANCAGLGELVYGYGRKYRNFVLLTLGTGIGGAIIIDRKLYRGTGYAGEPGQMMMGGTKLTRLASGRWIPERAVNYDLTLERAASGPGAEKRTTHHELHGMNTFEIRKLADKGDKRALKLLTDVGHDLGVGLLNIAYILDPEVFIIGGGFANVEYVLREARKVLTKQDSIERNIKVLHAQLKDDAGLVGASLLEQQKYIW